MTAPFLKAELINLLQDSKRKHADLRQAAEQSLADLKALTVSSEAQLAADLLRRPHFVTPFVLACKLCHTKLSVTGAACIQKLVATRALPDSRLPDVLDGLSEAVSLGVDVQLRVLQTLPSLFQYYADQIEGDTLVTTFDLCAKLQGSKVAAVSNTAAATVQQLVSSIFEKAAKHETSASATVSTEVQLDNGGLTTVTGARSDVLRIVQDFCRVLESAAPETYNIGAFSKSFVLELLESILANHEKQILNCTEQSQLLQCRLMPLVTRCLMDSEKDREKGAFSTAVRAARVLIVCLKKYMAIVARQCESALAFLIRQLDSHDNAASATAWTRALSLEVFKSLYSAPDLVQRMFSLFDQQDGHATIMKDYMACLVKLASEKPSLIGVGQQSTMPSNPITVRDVMDEAVTLETGVAGVMSTNGGSQLSARGISSQFSLARVPLLDTFDKQDAPSIPETYVYSLVLQCIDAIAESLARLVISSKTLTTDDERKRRDSDTATTPQSEGMMTCAQLIEECWPALLASCSTFLYAALDNDFYHNLVRSFQKIAHVAGLLRLTTPRDAFLTTLAKAAIPAEAFSQAYAPGAGGASSHGHLTGEVPTSPSFTDTPSSQVPDSPRPSRFSTRNLLCLRALLNLGIALGATLSHEAWFIIVETLWYADMAVGISTQSTARLSDRKSIDVEHASAAEVSKGTLGNEVLAVETAATKMIEATSDHPDSAFKGLLLSLLMLSGFTMQGVPIGAFAESPSAILSPGGTRRSSLAVAKVQRTRRSVSFTASKPRIQEEELAFVLGRISDLVRVNFARLSRAQDDEGLWPILSGALVSVISNNEMSAAQRTKAGNILNAAASNAMKLASSLQDIPERGHIQLRSLKVLQRQVSVLHSKPGSGALPAPSLTAGRSGAIEAHAQVLDTLHAALEDCGEALVAGWDIVFSLISSVFQAVDRDIHEPAQSETASSPSRQIHSTSDTAPSVTLVSWSPRLIKAAFRSLQLLSSDFLPSLSAACLLDLITAFYRFTIQTEEFNIALTTSSSFLTISDFLRSRNSEHGFGCAIESRLGEHFDLQSLAALIAASQEAAVLNDALWMTLLIRLASLSGDSRLELRNSVMQTLTHILHAASTDLTPRGWAICLEKVILVVADINLVLVRQQLVDTVAREPSRPDHEQQSATVDSAVLVISSLSQLIAANFHAISSGESFAESWSRLLHMLESTIELGHLKISEAVLSGLRSLLSEISASPTGPTQHDGQTKQAWDFWVRLQLTSPAKDTPKLDNPNQDAYLAYLSVFHELYRLRKATLAEAEIEHAIACFESIVTRSVLPRYSTDVDRLNEVQSTTLGLVRTLCDDKPASQACLLQCLSRFSDLCLVNRQSNEDDDEEQQEHHQEHDKRSPTFFALSKTTIELIAWYFREHGILTDILQDGTLADVLQHLCNAISSKYRILAVDRAPHVWRAATATTIDILRVALPWVERQYAHASEGRVRQIWMRIVAIVEAILSADVARRPDLSEAAVLADEEFDTNAFKSLKELLIPAMGAKAVPHEVRCSFSFTLLQHSLIFDHEPFAFCAEKVRQQPLEGLYEIPLGRAYVPRSTPRPTIAYTLLGTLLDLSSSYPAAMHSGAQSPGTDATREAYARLAQAALPYTTLRVAMTLKSYIADQPLRGLMPQPLAARKELLHVLSQLDTLVTDDAVLSDVHVHDAEHDAKDQRSDSNVLDRRAHERRHLVCLSPLIVRAVQVAGQVRTDGEILMSLTRLLDGLHAAQAGSTAAADIGRVAAIAT